MTNPCAEVETTGLTNVIFRLIYNHYSSECGWQTEGDYLAFNLMRAIEVDND